MVACTERADLSAISPFFIPAEQPTPLPPGHSLERVSLLIRHSAILGNDDEYEQTMGPFITKINDTDKSKLPSTGPWSFLREYESPIVEDTLEKISDRGKNDAKVRYSGLCKWCPDATLTLDVWQVRAKAVRGVVPVQEQGQGRRRQEEGQEGKEGKEDAHVQGESLVVGRSQRILLPIADGQVWTASSERDIDTAEAYIRGSFPSHQSGDHGEGDGEVVQLVKVPNKAKDWDRTLTPHVSGDVSERFSFCGNCHEAPR